MSSTLRGIKSYLQSGWPVIMSRRRKMDIASSKEKVKCEHLFVNALFNGFVGVFWGMISCFALIDRSLYFLGFLSL